MIAGAPVVRADDFKLGENPVSVIMKWRPTTPDPDVPDFVKASRPNAALEYKPVGGAKVDRPKLKTKAELAAMTKSLDEKAGALRGRGQGAVASASNSTARQLQAAGAESRRRAAQDFGDASTAAK